MEARSACTSERSAPVCRVLVVTNMYPTPAAPFYGIFVKEQVDSLRREGVDVDVHFVNGRKHRGEYFSGLLTLAERLRRQRYDIVHAHHTYCVYLAVWAARLAGRRLPLVFTFHEGEVHKSLATSETGSDYLKRLVFSKGIKKRALGMVDLVIAVQEGLLRALDFTGDFRVLPCGVDLDLFRPRDRARCREELGLPLDEQIVFFPAAPGNVNKGYDLLVEAVQSLAPRHLRVVAGGGIAHEAMPAYMSAADVVVQLSDYEASPMVLKEAMAAGVPVVFCDVGDARATVDDAPGIFLCERDPGDVAVKIGQALACGGRAEGRRRIVEAGLGLDDVARRVVGIYREVCAR